MAKPIYANSYSSRKGGRWKRVFIIIVLLQIAIVGVILYLKKEKQADTEPTATAPSIAAPAPADMALPTAEPAPLTTSAIQPAASTPESQAAIADAKAAIDGGQLLDAKTILDNIVAKTPDPEAIKLLGDVNMKLLKSPLPMPGKEYYTVQSGDYLFKIAKNFGTTVELIKKMNGRESDNIRLGERLLVFNGNFSIYVSKTHNYLDLRKDGKLFKRYLVGTGKFGKTPAVEFTIVDKIVEPPWTRPSDNKQVEFGDPENVLGTRWMALKAEDHPELTGFGIHGTWERDSIGKQSSAGCIRMLNENVEELFDLVPRKTTVVIAE